MIQIHGGAVSSVSLDTVSKILPNPAWERGMDTVSFRYSASGHSGGHDPLWGLSGEGILNFELA